MRPDRHAYGLRAWGVRHLHGAAGRPADPCLPDVCGAGRGCGDPHDRGAGCGRCAEPGAARLHCASWRAMRLLHPGLPDARNRGLGARTRYFRRRITRGALVQSVPLHRLPEHRGGGTRGNRRNARRIGMSTERDAFARRVFGRSVPRLEDRPLVRGQGQFVGDIAFPHQLHMQVVRSPYAHALLRGIDRSVALAAPGVVSVWTAADIADLPPIDFRDPANEALRPYRQPLLARDRLRYVGEPVAAVFATDAYVAEDAADLVPIDAEELLPVLDAAATPSSFAAGLTTEALVMREGYGEVDAAFTSAHAIVALDLEIGRHSGVPLETRGALARYDAARDVLELYGAAKVPHRNRDSRARMFGRSAAGIVLKE